MRTILIAVQLLTVARRRQAVGQVYTVGQGYAGQLGLGPRVVEMTRPALVDGLGNIVDVVAGGMHTLCLTADGKVQALARHVIFIHKPGQTKKIEKPAARTSKRIAP